MNKPDRSSPTAPKRWQQIAHRVWRKSRHDHLSVVAAGCAYYAFFAIFPALSAVISLYGLTADPAAVEQTFGVLSAVLPQQAYDIVIKQIRYIAESSTKTLGSNLGLSLVLAVWSTNAGVQAIFAALNIAYGQREQGGPIRYYASAFTFSVAGIIGGLTMLFEAKIAKRKKTGELQFGPTLDAMMFIPVAAKGLACSVPLLGTSYSGVLAKA